VLLTFSQTTLPTPSPYTTLFRSIRGQHENAMRLLAAARAAAQPAPERPQGLTGLKGFLDRVGRIMAAIGEEIIETVGFFGETLRSEEHTSELQSRENLVCRLLVE